MHNPPGQDKSYRSNCWADRQSDVHTKTARAAAMGNYLPLWLGGEAEEADSDDEFASRNGVVPRGTGKRNERDASSSGAAGDKEPQAENEEELEFDSEDSRSIVLASIMLSLIHI